MRLYLSSHRVREASDALVTLMRGTTRIGVIANAADDQTRDKREARLQREVADLTALGLDPAEIDLREYFEEPDQLRLALERYDALWVLGGNVIALRTARPAHPLHRPARRSGGRGRR